MSAYDFKSGLADSIRMETRMAFAATSPKAHAMITGVTDGGVSAPARAPRVPLTASEWLQREIQMVMNRADA